MLDVALFLLLVGAAVAVLYAVPDGSETAARDDADAAPAVATTLATTTTDVEYEPSGAGANVTDRGSVLSLLARSAVASASRGDGSGLAPRYAAAATEEIRSELRAIEHDRRVQVRAVWEPLPGSGLRGETTVGPEPPSGADVHAATTTVALGTARHSGVTAVDWGTPADESVLGRVAAPHPDATRDDAYRDWPVEGGTTPLPVDRRQVDGIEGEDCRAVALVVARRIVGHLFPPEQTRAALRAEQDAVAGDDATTHGHVAARYEAVAEIAGIDPSEVPRGDDARGTNARLVAGLAGALAPTACDGYEDASAAAAAAAPDEVSVVVRTWSP